MAICPNCKNELKEDFGLETCIKCGSVVFIELDDSVKLQDSDVMNNESDASILNQDTTSTEDDFFVKEVKQNLDLNDPILIDDPIFGTGNLISNESESLIDSSSEPIFISTKNTNSSSASDFFSEMQMFGDMDSEKFKESSYFFDIEIKGIDSKDVRDEILDHLKDSRLSLKVNDLDKKIKSGFLVLNDISAIKTQVIVQKISHLPCDISWKIKEVQDLGSNEENKPKQTDALVSDLDDFNELDEV